MESILTYNQKQTFTKFYTEDGELYRITIKVEYDDECRNGHNTFAITGDVHRKAKNGRWSFETGGCIHEHIAKHFPELEHLIKWHLVTSEGPHCYIENTVYLAGERDCWGCRKGEVKRYKDVLNFKGWPFTLQPDDVLIKSLNDKKLTTDEDYAIIAIAYDGKSTYDFQPKFTFKGLGLTKWHECPFDTYQEAEEWKTALRTLPWKITPVPDSWGEGKERELNSARRAAIWLDATDADLTEPGLEQRLEARLPKLMEEFKRDVEALGFVF